MQVFNNYNVVLALNQSQISNLISDPALHQILIYIPFKLHTRTTSNITQSDFNAETGLCDYTA